MTWDVAGLGNALMDALVVVEDDSILGDLGLTRGTMHPVNHEQWQEAYERIRHLKVTFDSGGSCANTVATVGRLGGKALYCGHVGDSRIYRLRNNKFDLLTEDHSLLNDYLKMKTLTPEEIENFPHKNVIVRALGMKETVQVDVCFEEPMHGDRYLLCSDGLSDMVEDDDIHLTISTFSANLQMAAEQLVQLANENGGRDNISVILSRVEKSFEAKKGFFSRFTEWFG